MLTQTVKQVVTSEQWTIDHAYRLYVVRDGDTTLYVGLSRDPFYRLQEHTGLGDGDVAAEPSRIGDLILRFLPDSLAWDVDLYTLDDCTSYVAQIARGGYLALYEENKGRLSAEKWCMEIAEEALIEVLRPCINISKNRQHRTPLPSKYRDRTPVNKGIHFE